MGSIIVYSVILGTCFHIFLDETTKNHNLDFFELKNRKHHLLVSEPIEKKLESYKRSKNVRYHQFFLNPNTKTLKKNYNTISTKHSTCHHHYHYYSHHHQQHQQTIKNRYYQLSNTKCTFLSNSNKNKTIPTKKR